MNISRQAKFIFLLFAVSFTLGHCVYQPYAQGERLYKVHCENCHAMDGSGLGQLIPPINQSTYLKNNLEELPCLIRNGIPDQRSGLYNLPMPPNPQLSEAEIANVINYIIHQFEYEGKYFSEDGVEVKLKECEIK